MSIRRASSSSILEGFGFTPDFSSKTDLTAGRKNIVPGRHVVLSIDAIPAVTDSENEEMKVVLSWVDEIKFRKQKKHLHRDFSDGVMMAELVSNFLPKLIELHNYAPASSIPAKKNNWRTLNRKVFSKLEFSCSDALIEFIISSKPGAIEVVLKHMYDKILNIMENRARLAAEQECRKNRGDHAGQGEGNCREIYCKLYGPSMDYIIFEAIKFVNFNAIEDKLTKLEAQDAEIRELKSKIRRLETLVSLKDERLCALSMELHQALQKNQTPKKKH